MGGCSEVAEARRRAFGGGDDLMLELNIHPFHSTLHVRAELCMRGAGPLLEGLYRRCRIGNGAMGSILPILGLGTCPVIDPSPAHLQFLRAVALKHSTPWVLENIQIECVYYFRQTLPFITTPWCINTSTALHLP
jgi:hypothetical protein